ncbi:MAG TPA: hypothetical protein VIA02_01060 [Candidatus Limnocylindria bacterium]|jgi:outer membrane protein assembly factor BamB
MRPPTLASPPRAALAALLLVAACTPAESPSPSEAAPSETEVASPSVEPSVSGPPTSELSDVAALEIEAEVAPDWPTILADSVWVLVPDGDDPAVLRLDPETGEEQARISLPGGSCEGIEAGFGSIWACTPDGLARIDPATNAIVATAHYQTPLLFGRPAVTDDAMWALSGDVAAESVVRIDPATNTVTATYPLGHSVTWITGGLGAVWGTATRDGMLLRVDAATGSVSEAATDLVAPGIVGVAADRVWVGLQWFPPADEAPESDPDLFAFDPATGTEESFDYGMRPESVSDITGTDDGVWVKAVDPFLFEVDPTTGEIVSIISSDHGSGAIRFDGPSLWMTLWRADLVYRIDDL